LTEDEKETETEVSPVAETSSQNEKKAPRSEDGELILKRREVHSGRAMTVSSVQWSVAENLATPSSALEGWMVSRRSIGRY
jgi:hypothetical protein